MGRFVALVVALGLLATSPSVSAGAGSPVIDAAPATRGQWLLLEDGTIRRTNGAPTLRLHRDDRRVSTPVAIVPARGRGAWVVGANGEVAAYGTAKVLSDVRATGIVDVAPGRRTNELLAVDRAGRVTAIGGGRSLGSLRTGTAVAIVGTPDRRGYWIVAEDGTIASFGAAPSLLTTTSIRDVVAAVATPSGRGLWLVSRHGGVATAGDAGYVPVLSGGIAGAARDGRMLVVASSDGAVVRVEVGASTATPPRTGGSGGGGGGGGGGGTAPVVTATTTTSAPSPVTTTTTTPPAVSTRDATRWPFASDSPWNLPIGDGATFAPAGDARLTSLLLSSATPWVNAGQYSHPIVHASDADPLATVARPGFPVEQYRIPASATPASGTDKHLHVVEPNGRWLHESWNTGGASPAYTTGYHVRTDLHGPGVGQGGVRAYGGSAVGGLIRAWELDAGVIRHALALAVTGDQLRLGPVWPATSQDGNAASTYRGNLPMGSYVAIPSSVNLDALGLRPGARVVAEALQDYGAYVVDRAGAFTLFADPSLEGDSRIADVRADLGKIRAVLGVVTNNTSTNVNGGGVRRAALAPSL